MNSACNTFQEFGILFCFDYYGIQECHSMKIYRNGTPNIKKEISSVYPHYKASLSSYRGSPFVTGSALRTGKGGPNGKTELLNFTTLQWETKADFPKRFFLTS